MLKIAWSKCYRHLCRRITETLEINLKNLLQDVQPDFMFFQAGVDILATDKPSRLAVSRNGCLRRDRIVLQVAKDNAIPLVSFNGEVATLKTLKDIVEAHANTYPAGPEYLFLKINSFKNLSTIDSTIAIVAI